MHKYLQEIFSMKFILILYLYKCFLVLFGTLPEYIFLHFQKKIFAIAYPNAAIMILNILQGSMSYFLSSRANFLLTISSVFLLGRSSGTPLLSFWKTLHFILSKFLVSQEVFVQYNKASKYLSWATSFHMLC